MLPSNLKIGNLPVTCVAPTLLVSGIPPEQNAQINANDKCIGQQFPSSSLLTPQVNHNRPWRSNSLTPPIPRDSGEVTSQTQCDISNIGIWSNTTKPRSQSLMLRKNGGTWCSSRL